MLLTPVVYVLNLYTVYKFNLSLNFMRTGYYGYVSGYPDSRIINSFWWSNTSSSTRDSCNLGMNSNGVNPQDNYGTRGFGYAIRCSIRVE